MAKMSSRNFSPRPLFTLACCFALGIALGRYSAVSFQVSLILAASFGITAAFVSRTSVAAILICFAFLSAGAAAYRADQLSISPDRLRVLYDSGAIASRTPVEVEGVAAAAPEPAIGGAFITMDADTLLLKGAERQVSGRVRLFVASSSQDGIDALSDLRYGSRIRVLCRLEREDKFRDPGIRNTRDAFDGMGIDATATVRSPLLVERIADESVFLPIAWTYDVRGRLIRSFQANLRPETAGVMIASLLGDQYFLDKDTGDVFRAGGTFHILVISGLHITFIGGVMLWFIRRLSRNRLIQFLVVIAFLWAYTLGVGAAVPVTRAAIMFTILMFAYVVGRRTDLLNSLGLCIIILLIWRPADLFGPSFQLTVISVFAIVAIAQPLLKKLYSIGAWTPDAASPFPPNVPQWLLRACETAVWDPLAWNIASKDNIWTGTIEKRPYFGGRVRGSAQMLLRYAAEGIIVSFIVQVSMLPLSVIYFHRVPFASVILNIWVGAILAVESFAAVIGSFLTLIAGVLARPFFLIADAANGLMLALPRVFTSGGWAPRIPAYHDTAFAVYFLYFIPLIIIAALAFQWSPFALGKADRRRYLLTRISLAATPILACIIILHPFSVSRPDGKLHIDFIDVGQGDSIFITFPDGRTMLIDGGGRFDYLSGEGVEAFERDTQGIGEAVVSPVLWSKGYSYIDRILATHADADHIEGLTEVVRNFGIGTAYIARSPVSDAEFAAFDAELRKRNIPVEMIARGDTFEIGGVTAEVLNPAPAADPNAVWDNNHSVVLRLRYRSNTFLLTGDIERRTEAELAATGMLSASDVVKAPHHGSRTSSTQPFVDAVRPRYAIISVGRYSPFGHPHDDVVMRWQNAGASVLTTGDNGMISISSDGTDISVAGFADGGK